MLRRPAKVPFCYNPCPCGWFGDPAKVRDFCQVDPAGKSLLKAAMQQLQMSAWAYHRILKLARTIADLAGSERIETVHLAEAIQYRPRRLG